MGELEQIKILTNKVDDVLINLVLFKTKKEIEAYTGLKYLSSKMENILIDMSIIKLNRLGTEELSGQAYSGVSENYLNDYPGYVIRQLNILKNNKKKRWGAL